MFFIYWQKKEKGEGGIFSFRFLPRGNLAEKAYNVFFENVNGICVHDESSMCVHM